MTIFGIELFAILGFLLGAYSIVANDAIQTLGTFLSSNGHRPWWLLWLFACSILVIVLSYGYFYNSGDIAFGRLNRIAYPIDGIRWWHAVPPLFLLALTRFGIPVSTTFLVLTIFTVTGDGATSVLPKMLLKSWLGYVVAFFVGGLIYWLIARRFEAPIVENPTRAKPYWVVLQWISTALLWSQWLIQDLANIFVFLPRTTTKLADGSVAVTFEPGLLIFAIGVMLLLHAYIFASHGGEMQKIITRKTNTSDIRSATIVDFIYAIILIFFKEISDIPMSTTWVFLGLLAGRELAIAWSTHLKRKNDASLDVIMDILRAFLGLVVSIILAITLPALAEGHIPRFFTG